MNLNEREGWYREEVMLVYMKVMKAEKFLKGIYLTVAWHSYRRNTNV
ncbi:hypothetical protein BSG1_02770 [Bacillus sp. SG-1]|nr:hypothetical protein BSG1_02770 [Bacillus sp. SG-1]